MTSPESPELSWAENMLPKSLHQSLLGRYPADFLHKVFSAVPENNTQALFELLSNLNLGRYSATDPSGIQFFQEEEPLVPTIFTAQEAQAIIEDIRSLQADLFDSSDELDALPEDDD